MSGKSIVLVGAQYGDEGKGKIVDYLIQEENLKAIARFNGGSNAGHTINVNGKELVTHTIPSGLLHDGVKLYIGSGTLVDPVRVLEELDSINEAGIDIKDRLVISPETSLVQPHHTVLDGKNGKSIGTTGKGIGPAYCDQANRMVGSDLKNVRFNEYIHNKDSALRAVRHNLAQIITDEAIITQKMGDFTVSADYLEKFVHPSNDFLYHINLNGENILFEGANGLLLDKQTGTVPFVTSSHTLAANAYVGGDLSPDKHTKTIGVAKAIMTRVGNGPFVSEFGGVESEEYCKNYANDKEKESSLNPDILLQHDEFNIGRALRILTENYGATTKRPRRVGALDLFSLEDVCKRNGVYEVALNMVDALRFFSKTQLPGIPVVVGYETQSGKKISSPPSDASRLYTVKPNFEYLDHFSEDISSMKDFNELPSAAKGFVNFVNDYLKNVNGSGARVSFIGVGPQRDQLIRL